MYTTPTDKDVVDLSNTMKILYEIREGYTLEDVWVTFPHMNSRPVWFVWRRKKEKNSA